MSIKDAMICDIETGICGPAETEEGNFVIGLVDLTNLSANKNPDPIEQLEKDK